MRYSIGRRLFRLGLRLMGFDPGRVIAFVDSTWHPAEAEAWAKRAVAASKKPPSAVLAPLEWGPFDATARPAVTAHTETVAPAVTAHTETVAPAAVEASVGRLVMELDGRCMGKITLDGRELSHVSEVTLVCRACQPPVAQITTFVGFPDPAADG